MSEEINKEEKIKRKWSEWQFKDGVSCIICDAAKIKKSTEKTLAECEDWEVKRKKQLQEDLKELTEMVSDIGDMKCSIRENGGVHNDRISTKLGATCYGADEICQSCGNMVKKNDYGDVEPIEHKENCPAINQIKSNQIKSNQIKSNQMSGSSSTQNSNKNYLPWILGGIGGLGLIGIVIYYFTKKKGGWE